MVEAEQAEASDGEAGDERETGRTLRQLLSLAEKSLLLPTRPEELSRTRDVSASEPEELEDDLEPAFSMLETVREYA